MLHTSTRLLHDGWSFRELKPAPIPFTDVSGWFAECSARFISEFGFAAPPDMRTFDEALPVGDQGVDTPAMRWHDKTLKGYETYLGFIALHYPAPTTLPDLVYYGQLNQAEGMKFGIEHFRRRRPHTMGTLVWQLNDCWPVQSWAWVDFRMRPKAAWYYARRFYAPLLLSLTAHEGRLSAYLVNDGPAPRDGYVAGSRRRGQWSRAMARVAAGAGRRRHERAGLGDRPSSRRSGCRRPVDRARNLCGRGKHAAAGGAERAAARRAPAARRDVCSG